ncbi:MAG: pilus assembly protein TadG-related protein [Beijerinckiaceae bacterium]
MRPSRVQHTWLRRFAKDKRGATAVVFALSLIPVTAGLGMGVDLGRVYLARTKLQSALDSAVLASAIEYKKSSDQAKALSVAASTFAAVAGTAGTFDTTGSTIDPATSQVNLIATTSVNTPLISIFSPSHANFSLKVNSQAMVKTSNGLGKNLEVSLMLDVTTSMTQNSGTSGLTKLAAMQTAAKSLINTIVQSDQSKYTSRVALAPFSSAVNLGSYYQAINGGSPPSTTVSSGSGRRRTTTTVYWPSVVERGGAYTLTDDPPSSASFPTYYAMRSSVKGSSYFITNYEAGSTSNRPDSVIMPLSSDKTGLATAIDNFTAVGATAGHIGIGWSWYMLSPNWSSIWTGSSTPNPADNKTVKIAILMSDFDFNIYYQGGVGDMNYQAAQLCANMKAAGIVVYTVGFQVDTNNTTAVNLFQGCASDPAKAIAASNGTELIAAYQSIANTVVASVSKGIRLSK